MHKQKTIAKWLAVIMLATLVVACYILITKLPSPNSVGTPSDNIAGADTDNEDKKPIVVPHYSKLPRQSETVGSLTVSHTGGEGKDIFEDVFTIDNHRVLIFDSYSSQYDVQSNGLHAAVFENGTLIRTTKIGEDSQYIGGALNSIGIVILSRSADSSTLTMLDGNASIIARSDFALYDSYKFHYSNKQLTLFCADSNALYAYTISDDTTPIKSAFLLQTESLVLREVLFLGSKSLIVADSPNGVRLILFDKNRGFTLHNELINAEFWQLLPCAISGESAVFIAAGYDGGLLINAYDMAMSHISSTFIENISYAVMSSDSAKLIVNTFDKTYLFCKHLDVIEQRQNTFFANDEILSLKALPQYPSAFMAYTDNGFCLYNYTNSIITPIIYAKTSAPTVKVVLYSNKIELYFTARADNDYTYMSFGGSDAFIISLLT